MGAWTSYGLGSPNKDLPSYVVLVSRLASGSQPQALFLAPVGFGLLADQASGSGPALVG